MMTMKEWEDSLLSKPIASRISGEHDEHKPGDKEFVERIRPDGIVNCGCQRCIIIRIKRRRAFKFPRRKCDKCGELYFGIFTICSNCQDPNVG